MNIHCICPMKQLLKQLFLTAALCLTAAAMQAKGSLKLKPENLRLVCAEAEAAPLKLAVSTLLDDFRKVMGAAPELTATLPAEADDKISLVVVNASSETPVVDPATLLPLDGFESHRVYADPEARRIYLYGYDMRGTIFAVYTFSEEVLGVPPLWYFCSWVPKHTPVIRLARDYSFYRTSPQVRYRAWFPNDTDLLTPWRKRSADNNERWLETMLRLKLNTVEMESTVSYPDYKLNSEGELVRKYGLVLTSHHHTPLNNSLKNWKGYWEKVRHTQAPELLLANEKELIEFWKYNIETVVRSGIENLWVTTFRGIGDQPFWAAFADAPQSDRERGAVISRMLNIQLDLIREATHTADPYVRITFYDELSDLLAAGYITPPASENMLWTFVSARRDHYPNTDLVNFDPQKHPVKLGYYMNLQFTSTGAHLAPAEGAWKMEFNYRYVDSKAPLYFSVVNAGNIREFVFELSANARMMWDMHTYDSDRFLLDYCRQYFGSRHADEAAALYKAYYDAYWQQKPSDFAGLKRQYLFHDLRHVQVLKQVSPRFFSFDPNPLKDIGYERVRNRSFRLGRNNQVDTLIGGTGQAAVRFAAVADRCRKLYDKLPAAQRPFFRDNLLAPCQYMQHLSSTVCHFMQAYKNQHDPHTCADELQQSVAQLEQAQAALYATQEGVFDTWYAGDWIFGLNDRLKALRNLQSKLQAAAEKQ